MIALDPRFWLALVVAAAFGVAGGYWKGHGDASAAADRERLATARAALRTIENATRENDEIRRKHQQHNDKVVNDYEKRLADVRGNAGGGLRVPRSICGDAPAQAHADAAVQAGDAGTGTIALPEQIDRDLWRLAQDCDAVAEQVRAMHDWLELNGLK